MLVFLNKCYTRLLLLIAIVRYLYNPNNVDSVLRLGNRLSSPGEKSNSTEKYKKNPEIWDLIQARYGLEDFPIQSFRDFHKNTLGFQYYHYIVDQGLNPFFYKQSPLLNKDSDLEYISYRLRQTHDIWHLITGFQTTQEGEAGLIAFYYAQIRSPLSALIIVLSFVHFTLRRPKELPLLLNEITRGWQQGLKAKPLLSVKWEELWDKELLAIKKDLKIATE